MVTKDSRKVSSIKTTNRSEMLLKVKKQIKNITIYRHSISQSCLFMQLIFVPFEKGSVSNKFSETNIFGSDLFLSQTNIFQFMPLKGILFFLKQTEHYYCYAKPYTDVLQCFDYPCNYFSLNNLCWEDHEALIKSLSGLERWQYRNCSLH